MSMIHDDPSDFAEDSASGFADLYSSRLRAVPGGVVRRHRPAEPKVSIIFGGGSGHYPAFAGLVGPGLGDGAVMGNIFTSPSTAQAYSVGRATDTRQGVIYSYGNYAGDVMNFGLAGDRLKSEGIDARQVIVTDDIASSPAEAAEERRGIAGDLVVYKVLGAAAEKGLDINEVERLGNHANARTFTLGVAFTGCTFPGATEPLFTVPEGKMGLGMGIHGEPGLRDVEWVPATELAEILVDTLLEERPADVSGRVGVIVNGLGRTKYEELFLLYGRIAPRLCAAGLEIVSPEVGELVTSLDMGGVSLTLVWLDEDLEELWLAPADSPAFRRGSVEEDAEEDEGQPTTDVADVPVVTVVGSELSCAAAGVAVAALSAMKDVLEENEAQLGDLDAVAGDGDHGRGMTRGVRYAHAAAEHARTDGWGMAGVLGAAGDAWGEFAGGTSGVLWGAGLRSFGGALGNETVVTGESVGAAVHAFLDALVSLGHAEVGDKTLVDAVVPFLTEFEEQLGREEGLVAAWASAASRAKQAADATERLSPKKGRARPLAERSIGSPDPGAMSFAMVVGAVSEVLAKD